MDISSPRRTIRKGKEARAQKAGRRFLEKWHEEKAMQEEMGEEIDRH